MSFVGDTVFAMVEAGCTPEQIGKAVGTLDAPKRKPTKRKPRTALAPDAQPNEADRAGALAAGLVNGHFRDQWQRFRDHHIAKGSLMADWSAAWRTWLGNMRRFNPQPQPQNGGVGDAIRQVQQRIELGSRPTATMLPGIGCGEGDIAGRLLPKR